MKLWLIKSKQPLGWDTYDSAIVAAETEEEARYTHPDGKSFWSYKETVGGSWLTESHKTGVFYEKYWEDWVCPDQVIVEYLGTTDRDIKGAVLSSFNAG